MEALMHIQRTKEYLYYLEEHILNVEKAWDVLQDKCQDMNFICDDFLYHWLDDEIKKHDLSKLSEFELVQYRKAFFPVPTEEKQELGEAWEHHKENNPHHWENWTKNDTINPHEWEIHCVHMVVDWMAMGFKFNDNAQQFYEKNKDKIKIPQYAIDFIYDIFKRIY
jgi:hypothetical protein